MPRPVLKRDAGFRAALLPLALMFASAPLHSAELEQVEVRSSAIQDVEAESPSAFVTVIEIKDRPANVESLNDILKESAGVQIRTTGGVGAFSTVTMRGAAANQLGVFIDGVPVGNSRMGTVDLSTIPIENVERVEIYRGYTPAVFYPSNLGGAINIVTKKKKGKSLEGLAYYGSWVTRGASVSGTYSAPKYSLSGFAEYAGTDGDFKFINDHGTPYNPDDDFEDTRRNNVSNAGSATFSAEVFPVDGLKLTVQDTPYYRKQGVPGIENIQSHRTSYEIFRNIFYFKGQGGPWGEARSILDFTVDHTYTWDRFSDPDGEVGVKTPRATVGSDNTADVGASVRFLFTSHQMLTIGTGFGFETYTPTDELPVVHQGGTSKRFSWHLNVEDNIGLFNGILTLTPTFRVETVYDWINVREDPVYKHNMSAERTDTMILPAMGVRIQPLSWLSIKGNVAVKGREPYFFEMFGDTGFTTPNPSLKPETGWQWDAGFSLDPDTFHFEYAYFQNSMRNLIQFTQNSQRTSIAINIGKAFISGHEVSLGWKPTWKWLKGIDLAASYTYQDPINLSPIPSQHGKQLPYRARNNLFLHAEYLIKGVRPWYEFTFISGSYFDPANLQPTVSGIPPRYIHDAGIDWTMPWIPITLSVECRNIGNDMAQDFAGYPLPGRSFYGKIGFRI